jgi:hypothetical protein
MDEGRRDRILDRVVDLLVEIRAEYLRSGANALKHWQQIHDRALLATRTSTRLSEWTTSLAKGLQLGAPSSSRSSATIALCIEVDADDAEVLDFIEDELGFVMARCRLVAEQRKAEREEKNA